MEAARKATAKPQVKHQVTAVYTDEDAALDRELDAMNAPESEPDQPIEAGPVTGVVKEKFNGTLLTEYLDVEPANTVNELIDQIHQAKEHNCDSIYATESLIRHYCRKDYPSEVGYFVHSGVKVYIPGFFEQANKRDNMSVQEKVFGLPGDKK